MPDSQNPDHVRKIIAEFQLKGQNLIPTVTGEIVPTVLVADLTSEERPEDRWAIGGVASGAAGAGNQTLIALANPAGSGVVLLLERFWLHQPNADIVSAEVQIAVTVGTPQVWRDTRLPGETTGVVTSFALASAVLPAMQWALVAATTLDVIFPAVLMPGTSIRLRQLNANETLSGGFFWRERNLLPGD